MPDSILEELQDIIHRERIRSVFQPIISLSDGRVLGHEALSRITGESMITNAEMLFQVANTYNRLWELEFICRIKSLEAAYVQLKPPYDRKLFINVNPQIMHDINFKNGFTKEYLKHYDIVPDNIVFEITERNAIQDMDSFKRAVDHYKNQEYHIAIDDAGAGYSGLNLISDVNPHYLKLDIKLIRDIDKDKLKYALVKGMIEFSHIAKIDIIAEGIENQGVLDTLIELGVQYGQGYYIQRPHEKILPIEPELVEYIQTKKKQKELNQGGGLSNIYIDSICKAQYSIPSDMQVEEVYNLFVEDANIYGMCIVENETVLGTITRENLNIQLSGRYGFSLNQKKKISTIMDKEYMKVEYQTPISTVSYLAMERENRKLYDMIVVTKEDKYYGTVTIRDLVKKATEIDLTQAKNQNPLSGLPGNIIIEQNIQRVLNQKEYTIMYFDIDNFKAFNDVYGFENGDLVIKILAEKLIKNIGKNDFAGHIGGDDFVVILNHHHYENIVYDIMNSFEEDTFQLYSKKDQEQGGIITTNRHGELEKYPFISVTIAAITNKDNLFSNPDEISKKLAFLKKKGKQRNGSVCICNHQLNCITLGYFPENDIIKENDYA